MPTNKVAPPPSAEEFARGRWDVVRWAWVYLGIRMHPGQERMAKAYMQRTPSRWRALYLWIMVAAGNRAGKTLALAIIILHSCVYRIGLEPPKDPTNVKEVERWGRLPYHWWHFAIEQGPAEQVFRELVTILLGSHPAQQDGCPWAKQVGGADKIATMSDPGTGDAGMTWGPKERGEYAWLVLSPDLGGGQVHFRSTKAKSLGSVGQNMHGLSFDEAGLETNLTFLLNEVMHARRLGTGGQFILISTPSAATSTDFEDLWVTGDPDDPFTKPRRFSMRMSSRDNVGYGLDQESFDALTDGMDENWIKQNIDGEFIQAMTVWFNGTSVDAIFDANLPEDQAPAKGHVYVHALDPGLKDKCWSLTFDIKPNGTAVGVHIERMQGKQTTRGIVALGKRTHHLYEQKDDPKDQRPGLAWIETGVDTTALGGHMFRDLLEEDHPTDRGLAGIPVKSVEFGGVTQVKRQMLSDARVSIDERRIVMPATGQWAEVRKQLRNYKLLDRRIEQDLVMCIAIIVKLIRQAPRQGAEERTPFEYNLTDSEVVAVSDGITPTTMRAKLAAKRHRALTAAASEA